jgi:hypothetical protein
MRIYNPGNILPCYNSEGWQRHRQIGTDTLPYGLPAPNTRLMPWQFYSETDSIGVGVVTWVLVNAVDETITVTQPSTILELSNNADGGYWITWKGEEEQGFIVPPCGFWFVRLTVPSGVYDFEVMHLFADASNESTALQLTGCALDETLNLGLDFIGVDTLGSPPVVSEVIEQLIGSDWTEVGTDTAAIFVPVGDATFDIRRTIVTSLGNTITATYRVTWTTGCSDLALVLLSVTGDFAGNDEVWRLSFANAGDKGTVLYQTGYTQYLYHLPIFNVPEIDRETEVVVDGNGTEISRFTRTSEVFKWETWNLPDYVLQFLSHAGDMDTVILEELISERQFELTNFRFSHRRQSPSLNIGEFRTDRQLEVYSGCQPNFALD